MRDELHSLVARAYLRKAGLFEPPPAFLRDILAFLREKYAGHILARTLRRIETFREVDDAEGNPYAGAADELHDRYKEFVRTYKLEDMQSETLDSDKELTYEFQLTPDGKSIIFTAEWGDLYYQMAQNGRPRGRKYGPYRSYKVKDKLYDAVNKAYGALRTLERNFGAGEKKESAQLVDLIRLEKECRKYTQKPKEYKSSARFSIPVDLSGWKYLDDFDLQKAQKSLAYWWDDGVTVVLDFKGHSTRGGQWDPQKVQLQVDMWQDATTVEQFRKNMNSLLDTAKHEAQHVGQDALKLIKRLNELAGLPSPDVRSPDHNPYGIRPTNYSAPMQDHALRDVEFHTRLRDEVDEAVRLLPRIPKEDRRDMLRLWAADLTNQRDLERLWQYNDFGPYRNRVKNREFFEKMKRRNLPKWKKAVKDYITEVMKKVQL